MKWTLLFMLAGCLFLPMVLQDESPILLVVSHPKTGAAAIHTATPTPTPTATPTNTPAGVYVDPIGGNDGNGGSGTSDAWKTVNKAAGYSTVYIKRKAGWVTLAVPAANLTAYWPFDDASGVTVTDYSGNGYNGTFAGTPTWVAKGVAFAGGASTAVNASAGASPTGTEGTLIVFGSIASVQSFPYVFTGASGASGLGMLFNSTSDKLEGIINGSANSVSSYTTPLSTMGIFVVRYKVNDTFDLFESAGPGSLTKTSIGAGSASLSNGGSTTINFAVYTGDILKFYGTIAHALTYSRKITDDEVTTIYTNVMTEVNAR